MQPFDPPLAPDPALCLLPPPVESVAQGPARQVQYVVELVGPRSAPAGAAAHLVSPDWFRSLGQPELFCMGPADNEWKPLTARTDGSYDSIASCWDIVSPEGALSRTSATHLLQQLERFASAINRRAVPLPDPGQIERVAKGLMQIQQQLDIGVSLAVIPRAGAVREHTLWTVCAKLGLEYSPQGAFDWKVEGSKLPLISVTPIGVSDAFSLGSVRQDVVHEGVTVGFSVPRCPAPIAALEGALHIGNTIASFTNSIVTDDEGRPITTSIADEMRRSLKMGVQALEQAGLKPGSSSAIKLFSAR